MPPRNSLGEDVSAEALGADERVAIISDLHLGSIKNTHEDDERIIANLIKKARQSDHLILNGDTIDFEATRFEERKGDGSETLAFTRDFLTRLADGAPNTNIIIMGGNHDWTEKMDAEVRKLAREREAGAGKASNIGFYPNTLMLDGKDGEKHLIMHGDRPHVNGGIFRGEGNDPSISVMNEHDVKFGAVSHAFEEFMIKTGAQRLVDLYNTPERISRQIANSLDPANASRDVLDTVVDWTQGKGHPRNAKPLNPSLAEATHISTGHTHDPYSHKGKDGRQYENSGSMGIPGTEHNWIEFDIPKGAYLGPLQQAAMKDQVQSWREIEEKMKPGAAAVREAEQQQRFTQQAEAAKAKAARFKADSILGGR